MRISWIICLGILLGGLQTIGHPGTAAADGHQTTLERIAASGEINIGFRESEPPMSFRDQAGNPVGYSMDLCAAISEAISEQLELPDLSTNYVPVTAETRFEAIESGQIDLLCGATTKTLGRSERVGFTLLTFATGASLMSIEGNGVERLADLSGKRIAVVKNTTTIEALSKAIADRGLDAEVVPVVSAEEGMAKLDQGEVAAFSSDQVVLIGLILARPSDKTYTLSTEILSYEPFALALQRGDADFQLLANRTLASLYRSGKIGEIYTRWFGRFAEEPPNAVSAVYSLGRIPE